MGVIRIGTLHDFRKLEHGKGRTDTTEGKKSRIQRVSYLTVSGDSDQPKGLWRRFVRVAENVTTTFIACDFLERVDHTDCFILCSSMKCSKETMTQFEGTDSCIEITKPKEFYSCLTKALNMITPVTFQGAHEVTYGSKLEEWQASNKGNNATLLKDPEYKEQCEIRAIWKPLSKNPIEPLMICNHKLGGFCREINF